ncbi:hypothetical protein M0R45_008303 [Rubus argutus]|uniref:Ubiquitin-like protease family profile domain-containing protein n=1 Tax=Rubus argutus TaxID=59490 RepID=A0AAW1Y1C2_RUBAR
MLETMQIVKDSHLKLLQRTPFWPLLEAFHNGTIAKSQYQLQDEVHDEVELNHLVFYPLLRSMAHIDYVFFPIISKFHYTLLVLNKNEKKWTHYNPLRKRSELHIDPCYEIAKQMHQLIQKWLLRTQKEAQQALLKRTKRKKCRKEESGADVIQNIISFFVPTPKTM